MKNFVLKKSSVLLSILFVISPFFALPVIFYFIYKRSYVGIVFFALFMGIMSHLILPSGDLYRYHLQYDLYKISEFSEITNTISFDFVYTFGIGRLLLLGASNLPGRNTNQLFLVVLLLSSHSQS